MKLTGVAATTNEMRGDERGIRFTPDDLALMAEHATGMAIFTDFDRTVPPVGKVEGAAVEDGTRLRVVVEVTAGPDGWPIGERKLYCVPGVVGQGAGKDFRVTELTEFGLTHAPCDLTLDALSLLPEPVQ